MTSRWASALAWGLWVFSVMVTGAMVAFYLLGTEIVPGDRDRAPLAFVPVMALFVLAFSSVGALVASHLPGNAVGWLFSALGLAAALGFAGQFYADYTLVAEPGALAGGTVVLWLDVWTIVPALTMATFVALLFPTGNLVSGRWKAVAALALGGGLLATLGLALEPGPLDEHNYPGVSNPFGLDSAANLMEGARTVGVPLAIVALLSAVVSIAVRFRRSSGVERQQIKWIAYAAAVAAVAFVVVLPAPDVGFWDDVVFVVAFVSMLAVPVAAGVAILRYRLYDIDVVINRTLVYGSVTALLAGAYLGLVLLLQFAFRPITAENSLAVALSTLAVAALFRPARTRVQALVDRRFYRRKYDAQLTLAGFSARLRDEVDLNALRAELTGVVAETMQPAHVSLWLPERESSVTPSVTIPRRSSVTKEPR